MFQADILFIKNDKFYDQKDANNQKITGYELFFKLINDFKNKFNYSIHTFESLDKTIQFNFNSDYIINLKEYSNARYIELYSHSKSIENFVEKYNYLKNKICELNIL